MIAQVATLLRYRMLIQSLVGRELKARYRGSILGFFWSFVNPLLLLLTYWLVFTYMLPGRAREERRAVLPVPLLRDPALDLVPVLGGGIGGRAHRRRQPHQEGAVPGRGAAGGDRGRQHGPLPASACPSCCCSCSGTATSRPPRSCCPCPCWCSSCSPSAWPSSSPRSPCTSATSRASSPTCCTSGSSPPPCSTRCRRPAACTRPALQPHGPRAGLVPGDAVLRRPSATTAGCSWPRVAALVDLRRGGVALRPAARHPGGGGVTVPAAVTARDLTKVYRRFLHRNQFRTLKSALLSRSLISDLAPRPDLHRARRRVVRGAARDRPSGSSARTARGSRRC